MALFLTNKERSAILSAGRDQRVGDFYWALLRRVEQRTSAPGLLNGNETVDWWRPVAEYLTDAAMAYALKPSDVIAVWLRDVTLSLIRRPQDDWVGPHYRNHRILPDGSQIGHLETAHICWAVAIVLDLAGEVFIDSERQEVHEVLHQRGAQMCLNWLDRPHSVANWWCVLTAGLTVTAAVLKDETLLERARCEADGCSQVFQQDGSYAESLQYANYAMYTLMLASEALRRLGDDVESVVPLKRYIGYSRWAAASYLYSRPTTGWGASPKPRSLNFNDSGAVFKPTADLLLHFASRGRESHAQEAGLARWLFEQTYAEHPGQGPHDQASFGLRTDWGFLTLPLLVNAAPPVSPQDTGFDTLQTFDCGNSIARDAWNGRTVLAMHGGGEPMNGPGHLHRDLNTIMLVHNRQRLLTEAGHSCYRNVIRQLEVGTDMHNTCIFHASSSANKPMGGWMGGETIEQREPGRRLKRDGVIDPPVDRGARRLIAETCDDVRVMGSDAAVAYGAVIERFARFAILCGSHVVFIVDHIRSSRPVRTQWNWLLNNRDGELDLKVVGDDRVVARRGDAGMKLFSDVGGGPNLRWAYTHDAYHCMPGQLGEGRLGSATLLRWTEPDETTERINVHAIALDTYGAIAGWHLRAEEDRTGLEGAGGACLWQVHASPTKIVITERESARGYQVVLAGRSDHWSLAAL